MHAAGSRSHAGLHACMHGRCALHPPEEEPAVKQVEEEEDIECGLKFVGVCALERSLSGALIEKGGG